MLLPGIYLTAESVRTTITASLDLLDRKARTADELGDDDMSDAFHTLFMLIAHA
jgi:hypothetical protein